MAGFLEKVYPYVPVWAQNLGISAYGLAWKRERFGGRFDEYVAGFQERDDWGLDQMQDYLTARLRKFLLHALEQVPYYREQWKAAGITAKDLQDCTADDFNQIPITQKEDLRSDPDAFVARNVADREKLHRYHSSGSSGTPIQAVCTADAHRRFIAAREVRSLRWAGCSYKGSRSMIGGRLVIPKGLSKPPFHRFNLAEKQVYFSAYHISPETVASYLEAFNHYRPELLTGYAYSYYILARMMADQGVTLDYEPKALVLSSEKLTPPMKEIMKKSFRARAFEEYGAVENCMLATECEHGNLHSSQDFGIIQLVDGTGGLVQPGMEGRVICTTLQNYAQPLIRYEVGDVAVWSGKECACGRNHLPVIQEIVGRLEDEVIGADGRVLVRFHGIWINMPNVTEGQVVQESLERFTVNLVADDSFNHRDEELIRHRFQERLGPVQVAIQRVDRIPRSERGKFKAVVSKLSDEDKAKARNGKSRF